MAASSSLLPARWRTLLDGLRDVHTDLKRLAPSRDDGLAPSPSAHSDEIEDTELRLGVQLPPAYREFLSYSNGWQRVFGGASFLGTRELGDAQLKRAARSLLTRALPTGIKDDRFILPFGSDPQHTTLFAFDYSRGGREPAVIAWVEELGVTSADFTEFLAFLLSLSRADLAEQREQAAGLLSAPPSPQARASAA